MLLAIIDWLERRRNLSILRKAGTLVPSSLTLGRGVVFEISPSAKIKIGPNVSIGSYSTLRVFKDGKLEIAAKSQIGDRVTIACGKSVSILTNAKVADGAIITDVDPIFGGPTSDYSHQAVTVQENGYISPNAFYGKKPGKSLGRSNEGEEASEGGNERGFRRERNDRPRGGDRGRDNHRRGGGGGRRDMRPSRDNRFNNNRNEGPKENFEAKNDGPEADHSLNGAGHDKQRFSVPASDGMTVGPIRED